MNLLDLSLAHRVIIGISAMVLLFASFLVAFITNQRRKLEYHKNLHLLHEQQQQELTRQNELLEQKVAERTLEISQQKEQLQTSLSELKATQLQLIQREKMASLGELTAGIAHEIQNPLNFVNNFSDVSLELADELDAELAQKNEAAVKGLAAELKENLSRINEHGKRAEAIVRGMLQHASTSSGSKEYVDLNSVAEEYLRLTYQSFRSKNKGFTAKLDTQYDKTLEKVNAYPLDLARVLVNLYTNALYSLCEKQKTGDFEPVLSITTRKAGKWIEIEVRDNGQGIPQKVAAKIFQPFFTTKPAGQGTGLGLSLSYEIINHAHGGELLVNSKEGEGAAFTVRLPG